MACDQRNSLPSAGSNNQCEVAVDGRMDHRRSVAAVVSCAIFATASGFENKINDPTVGQWISVGPREDVWPRHDTRTQGTGNHSGPGILPFSSSEDHGSTAPRSQVRQRPSTGGGDTGDAAADHPRDVQPKRKGRGHGEIDMMFFYGCMQKLR